jgi:hypothetical protein
MSRVHRGDDARRMTRKGGTRDLLAIDLETAQPIQAFLNTSSHDLDGFQISTVHRSTNEPWTLVACGLKNACV